MTAVLVKLHLLYIFCLRIRYVLPSERRKRGTKFTKQTQKKIRDRSKAWQKYQQNRSGRKFEKYKRLRNDVNRCIKQEENLERKRVLKGFKGNPKRFYGYMRHMQSVKDKVIALKKENGELTETDQETADLLSTYFQEVYTCLLYTSPSPRDGLLSRMPSSA